MATGFPVKANYATGDVLTAANMNDLSGTVNYLQYMPPRNSVLNSNMSVWQRGTSFSITSTNAYTADRWNVQSGGAALTASRQATNDTTNLPNIQYCLRVQRNSGQTSTAAIILQSMFETVNSIPFAGKTVTLSFYARKGADWSAASSNLNAKLYTGTGTDQSIITGSYTGQVTAIDVNATLTTTWQRFSYSATFGATVSEMALYFRGDGVGTAGTNDYFEITGVQLELGSVANTYMPNQPTYQGELAACQRYYYRATTDVVYGTFPIMGFANATTTIISHFKLPVTMRVKPSSVEYPTIGTIRAYDGVTTTAMTALALSANSSQDVAYLDWTVASGLTQYRPYIVAANNSASAYVGVSAEL